MSKIQELRTLNSKVQRLTNEENVDWDLKYDMIFSENISRKVFSLLKELGSPLDYYDPDTSEEEDVKAFSDALKEKMEELEKINYMFE